MNRIYSLLITRLVESAQRNRYFLVDFSRYFDDVSQWVFLDWCHLTAGANYLIAKELSTLIKERLFQQPLTEGDRLGAKDSYFYVFATSAEVE